jgi:HK97 family phage prohead protease
MKTETRSIQARYETPDGNRLVGYAAVWDSPTEITEWGKTFNETIRRGAFARSLKDNPDVVCCVHHDETRILGRTTSGTLKLNEDIHGLRFEVDLPQHAHDIRELVQRGDLSGASFRFEARADRWDGNSRELLDVDLFHVSVVVHPAYRQTSVSVRGNENWKLRNALLRKLLPEI